MWNETLLLEGFWEGHDDVYDVSRRTTLYDYLPLLLAEFGELPIE
jgi:hypothetical protein